MKINKIWEFPMLSSELGNDSLSFHIEGKNVLLSFIYTSDKNVLRKIELRFITVFCYMHTSENFTKQLLDAYDTVVQVEESEWLHEIKGYGRVDFDFWKPRHYAVYFDSVGLYQFIARDFLFNESEVYR